MAQEDVLTIANRYLHKVKRSGNENIMALCPFHRKNGQQERHPSFAMSLTTGLWICHACKEVGNLRTFLKHMGVGRQELDARYSEVIKDLEAFSPAHADPLRPKVIDDNPLPEAFLGLFDQCPIMLEQEGLNEEILRYFDIGYDPIHERITFPLRDFHGRLVGISGRALTEEQQPRYKIYDDEYLEWELPPRDTKRSHLLWNFHEVFPRVSQRFNQSVVLVEGFKGCMWLVQAGISNTVSAIGSYLSEEQQWMIEKLGSTVYIMFDNDMAGQKGLKVSGKKLSAGLRVKVVTYEKKQPTDLTPQEIYSALDNAIDYYAWALQKRG